MNPDKVHALVTAVLAIVLDDEPVKKKRKKNKKTHKQIMIARAKRKAKKDKK